MNFDQAFAKLLGHEGDYSDDDQDPGGKTRYGITEEVARANGYQGDMRSLPVAVAQQVYITRYWRPLRADELPDGIRYVMFDAAVNCGLTQAIKWLQRAVGATDDGILGPKTLMAAQVADPRDTRMSVLGQQLDFKTDLRTWSAFGRGWSKRIASMLKERT